MRLEVEMNNYIRNFNQSVMIIKIDCNVEIEFTSNQNIFKKIKSKIQFIWLIYVFFIFVFSHAFLVLSSFLFS